MTSRTFSSVLRDSIITLVRYVFKASVYMVCNILSITRAFLNNAMCWVMALNSSIMWLSDCISFNQTMNCSMHITAFCKTVWSARLTHSASLAVVIGFKVLMCCRRAFMFVSALMYA